MERASRYHDDDDDSDTVYLSQDCKDHYGDDGRPGVLLSVAVQTRKHFRTPAIAAAAVFLTGPVRRRSDHFLTFSLGTQLCLAFLSPCLPHIWNLEERRTMTPTVVGYLT
jgi:hypothetical protein